MVEFKDLFQTETKVSEGKSRREALVGGLALLFGTTLPGEALANTVGRELKGTKGKVGDILGEDKDLKGKMDELAKPRIDELLSADEIAAYTEQVGFRVKELTVPLHNRVSLETVRLAYGENGEFAWVWQIAAGGRVPFMHCHVDEEETILLTKGSLSCDLEGHKDPVTVTVVDEPRLFVIPKDTFHQPFNEGTETVEGIVHFENPHEAAPVSTVYWNMVEDGLIEKKHGKPNFLKLLAKTGGVEHSRTNIPVVPPFLQDFTRKMASFFGTSQEELSEEFSGR